MPIFSFDDAVLVLLPPPLPLPLSSPPPPELSTFSQISAPTSNDSNSWYQVPHGYELVNRYSRRQVMVLNDEVQIQQQSQPNVHQTMLPLRPNCCCYHRLGRQWIDIAIVVVLVVVVVFVVCSSRFEESISTMFWYSKQE